MAACAVGHVAGGGGVSEGSEGNTTGFHLGATRATALIYGTVRTPASVAVPYFGVEAETDGGSQERRTAGVTDVNGNYALSTVAGCWRIGTESPGYPVPEAHVLVPAPATAVLLPMMATPVTVHLRGQVRDNHNNPVPGIELIAHDYQNTNAWGLTDAAGNFDLGVHGGAGGTE